jgi:hypothetical protein
VRFSLDDRGLACFQEGSKLRLLRIIPGRELRVLRSPLSYGQGPNSYLDARLSADGRLLAVHSLRGLALVDLAAGQEVALIPAKERAGVCQLGFDTSRALRTYGAYGLLHWPVQASATDPGSLRIGPPKLLGRITTHNSCAQSANGRVVVVPNGNAGAVVLHPHVPSKRFELKPQRDVRSSAVSPDDAWIATGSHDVSVREGAKVWNAATGQHVKTLPVGGLCHRVGFSPDGRCLATHSGMDRQCHLWTVGSWEAGPKIVSHGGFAFSPRGNWLAVGGDLPGSVLLVKTATGKEITRLSTPDRTFLTPLCITPDEAELIAVGDETGTLHVWDLRAIRRQLAERGLDYDLPTPQPQSDAKQAPLRVALDLGELAPQLATEAGARHFVEEARQDWTKKPDDPMACNNLAWAYLIVPEALRDVQAALPLAKKAVRLAPGNATYGNTLGLAYYRAGRYREAVATLRPNLERQQDSGLGHDFYILAMSCQRLGESERAHDYYTCGVRWTRARQGQAAEEAEDLTVLRTEAEAILGTKAHPASGGQGTRPELR